MKKIINLFIAACTAATLVSCNNKLTYEAKQFITFDDSDMEVAEDCGTLAIPVTIFNCTKDVTATIKVESDGTVGTDFEIVDNPSGVLNFTKDKNTDTLFVKILPHVGEYTGNFEITLSVESAGDGVVLGAISALNIVVLDKDIPVDWDFFAGKWTATDYTMAGAADGGAYEISITKTSETTFTIGNLWGGGQILTGAVEFNAETNSAVIAIKGQQVGYVSSAYGPCWFLWFNGSSLTAGAIPGTLTAAGLTIGDPANGIGYYVYIASGTYAGYGLNDGNFTKCTK